MRGNGCNPVALYTGPDMPAHAIIELTGVNKTASLHLDREATQHLADRLLSILLAGFKHDTEPSCLGITYEDPNFVLSMTSDDGIGKVSTALDYATLYALATDLDEAAR